MDIDGLKDRVLALPIQAANYRNLQSVGSTLYYIRQGSKDAKPALADVRPGARKETALGSVGRLRDLRRRQEDARLAGRQVRHHRPAQRAGDHRRAARPVRAWRCSSTASRSGSRSSTNAGGRCATSSTTRTCTAWTGRRCATSTQPLVAHVNHRADLTYVIGEMIGELNAGHAYVGGGDMPQPPRIPTGLLGAELRRDPATGYYQIAKILRAQLGRQAALAADRDRRRRQGRRLHHRRQRPADQRDDQHLRGAGQHGRQAGDAQAQRRAEGEGQPRGRGRADRQTRRSCITTTGWRATSRR